MYKDILENINLLPSEIQISDIRTTKQGRYAIFIKLSKKQVFLFSTDEETLYKAKLKIGDTISLCQLLELQKNSNTKKAIEKAFTYLSLRAYAQQELYNKLNLKFDEYSCNAAIEKMIDLHLIDDITFCENRVASLIKQGKSKQQIKQKLMQIGVDREIVDETLQKFEFCEAQLAENIIQKSYIKKLEQGKTANVIAALQRKGFSYTDIKIALENILEKTCFEQQEYC